VFNWKATVNKVKKNPNSSTEWFVVYTKARHEDVALQNLERQGFEVYLPLVETLKRKKGLQVSVITPFFPRYLFVRFDCSADDWGPIRSTRGVCGLVKFGGLPKPVPPQLIEILKNSENSERIQTIELPCWKPGEEVAIEQGPLAGYSCIFMERRSGDRVAVLLNIVGKASQTVLPIQDLQIPQFT